MRGLPWPGPLFIHEEGGRGASGSPVGLPPSAIADIKMVGEVKQIIFLLISCRFLDRFICMYMLDCWRHVLARERLHRMILACSFFSFFLKKDHAFCFGKICYRI